MINELKFIKELMRIAGSQKDDRLELGIGDDAAAFKMEEDKYVLISSDAVTAGVHFETDEKDLFGIGHKAASVALSDIAACGGGAKYVLTDIAMPREMSFEERKEIFRGLVKAAEACGSKIIGGDTVASSALMISVTAVGFCKRNELVRRSGAREGDLIFITGPVRNGKKEHLRFKVRSKEARELVTRFKLNAMIDTSDGICPDLLRLCEMSASGCEVWPESVPLSRGLSLKEALYYGESFELLFCLAPDEARKVFSYMKEKKIAPEYFLIGRVRKKEEGCYLSFEKKKEKIEFNGYRHF